MKSLRLVTMVLMIFSGSYLTAQKFSPPKWEGHWESYSKTDPGKMVASLDLVKVKGKEYTYKLWIKPDFSGPTDQPCPEKVYIGTATWNGANGLDSQVKSMGFVYLQETGFINIYHDYSDPELTDLSFCFDAGDLKKTE